MGFFRTADVQSKDHAIDAEDDKTMSLPCSGKMLGRQAAAKVGAPT
jgi:hypothetical protein